MAGRGSYWSKWATFSAAAFMMLSAGLAYSFSIYGDALGDAMGYQSQSQRVSIGTAGNIGGYCAIVAGLFHDRVSRFNRMGPKFTVSIGCLLYAIGYFGLYAAATHRISAPYWLVLLLAGVAGNGGCWLEAAALTTAVRNFETERGAVVGILKAFLGLSASTYTTVYIGFIAPNSLEYLVLLAIAPACVAAVASVFVNYVPFVEAERHLKSHAFHMVFTAVGSLAAFQIVSSTALARQSDQHRDVYEGIVLNMALFSLLIPMISLPYIFGGLKATPLVTPAGHVAPGPARLLEAAPQTRTRGGLTAPLLESEPKELENLVTDEQNLSPSQALFTPEFWLLATTAGVASGAGLILSNNMGALVVSLGADSDLRTSLVSTYSVANCLGRVLSGFIPERYMRRDGTPRTFFLLLMTLVSALSSAANGLASARSLPIATFIAGIAFGSVQGLVPSITSELFGLRSFASNYGMVQLALALGSYGMATALAGTIYQDVKNAQGNAAKCVGEACFRYTFFISAALCGGATVAAFVLYLRSWDLYHRLADKVEIERQKRGKKAEMRAAAASLRNMAELNNELQVELNQGKEITDELRRYIMTNGGRDDEALANKAVRLGNILATATHKLWRRAGVASEMTKMDTMRRSLDGPQLPSLRRQLTGGGSEGLLKRTFSGSTVGAPSLLRYSPSQSAAARRATADPVHEHGGAGPSYMT